MDALEYAPARLEPNQRSILIEGKTDFYCFEYFNQIQFENEFSISLFPGGGSGTLDPLITLLAGWGVEFLILLDGDASGLKESSRYKEKFESLVTNRITNISELLGSSENTKIENVFDSSDLEKIRVSFFPNEKKLTKKLLHHGIQEMLANKVKLGFSEKTLVNFKTLLKKLEEKHSALAN